MSTQAAEDYQEPKNTVPCKVCAGEFVPGGFKMPIPEGFCIWCFTRGSLYKRYTLFWAGLTAYYNTVAHGTDCDCYGCQVYRVAEPIMSATMQTPQTNQPSG